MTIDTVTKTCYEKSRIVELYASWKHLWRPETVILDKFRSDISDKKVLDIGCGGGRTTKFLMTLTQQYLGIDYSDKMIQACKVKYPSLQFMQCDSSDMSMVSNESFDFVLFSFNGIDCMSQNKRIRTLNEVYRVLKNNGVFAFSSHNRDDSKIVVGFNRYERISLHSIKQNILNVCSYLKSRKEQEQTETYAILSDPLAGFGQLSYYIRKSDQLKQLADIGFHNIEIVNFDGEFVDERVLDQTSHWFYYVCRKQ